MPKKDPGGGSSKKDNPEVKLSVEEKDLLELVEDLEQKELMMAQQDEGNDNEDGHDKDDKDGWVDELDELYVEECEELKLHIHPISHVLVKVWNS